MEESALAVAAMAPPALVDVANLSKTYPGTRALDGASISIRPGEVHALLGTNGSGKSTLIKVLTGVVAPDPGAQIAVRGRPRELHRGATGGELDGLAIRCVHQDLGLVDDLSIVDNVALADGWQRTPSGTIDWSGQRARTRELLRRVGLTNVDVDAPVRDFDGLIKTQIAIARVLGHWGEEPGLLILDEPTASLPEAEAGRVFELVNDIRDAGNSVLYVSHRLAEIFALSDRVTVLRQGRVVHTGPTGELNRESLVEHMLGHRLADGEGQGREPRDAATEDRLVVEDLRVGVADGLSFAVRSGEILGLAGVAGSGHDDVARALIGGAPASGTLRVRGRAVDLRRHDPVRAKALGIAFVPPDRKREGLLMTLSVRENVMLPVLEALRGRLRWLREQAMTRRALDWSTRVALEPRDPDRVVALLSGGNQQKVVVARCLATEPDVLLLSEPTAGVDVAAREQIWSLIREAADDGLSVVVNSADAGDLAALCDRVLILRHGVVHATLEGPGLTESRITAAVLASH
jgi:ribose transport system ATP-binding protein